MARIEPRRAVVVLSLLAAAVLFARFGLDGRLSRDEALYTYGGQQMARGLPPYVGIFDPKTPLAQMLCGLGAAIARLIHADDLDVVRIAFYVPACLAVAAVALLAMALFDSWAAGVAAAVALVSFKGFASDALGGPDAKTPGVLLAVLAMLLTVRGRWFLAGAAGSLAFLVWQPLGVFALVAVLGAVLAEPGTRRRAAARALAGAAVPVAATLLYFWIAGALSDFVEAAVRFPLTGIERSHESLSARLQLIDRTVDEFYGRIPFYGGIVAAIALVAVRAGRRRGRLRGLARDPYVVVVAVSLAAMLAFPLTDFQGYPDLFPLLPYAALGIGGAVALLVSAVPAHRRRAGGVAVLVLAAAAAGVSWARYSGEREDALSVQRADAALAASLAGDRRGGLWALGDPVALVLLHRRNPSRYIYLGSGVDRWKVDHTIGGFDGWTAQIRAVDPAVIVMHAWRGTYADDMRTYLEGNYRPTFLGGWEVFVRDHYPAAP